jgi:holo-[acyl-carrier protein] synthase
MIGIDIVQIDRIKLEGPFIRHILTPDEQQEMFSLHADYARKEYMAGRFAVKEAIFKATQDQAYLNYACLHEKSGKPYIKDHPEIEVSISHDGGIATAIVQIPNE